MDLKGRNFLKLLDFTPEEIEYLLDLSSELKAEKKNLELFKDILGSDELKIATASLKTNVPAIISEDEQTRRMSDITKMFGGGFTAPKTYTLIVNTDSPLVNKLSSVADEEIKKDICRQIYDIARICHSPLEVDELAKFIERSTSLLERLADK